MGEWGGDVIKFAGDAMLVVWRNEFDNLDYDPELVEDNGSEVGKQTEHAFATLSEMKNEENLSRNEGSDEEEEGDEEGNFAVESEPLSTLLLRAIGCNLTLISTLNNFSPTEGVTLSLHTGIGVGYMSGLFVGGVQDNWEFFDNRNWLGRASEPSL